MSTDPHKPPFAGAEWTGEAWLTPERAAQIKALDKDLARRRSESFPVQAIEEAVPRLVPGYPVPTEQAMRLHLEQAVAAILEAVDPDPNRGGLDETPVRAAKAWQHWTSGYGADPAAILKCFEDGAQGCDEMVVVRNIPVYSHCEHHLAPIFGTATVGYLPDQRIVGLSKLPRLVEIFMRRLQVQERMTNQIADAIMQHLAPLGCGVVIRARHMCMESRGVQLAGTETVTSAMRGAFRDDPRVRSEFLDLARGG